MRTHWKKLIAPVLITFVLVAYYAAFAAVCIMVRGIPLALKLACGLVPLALAGVSLYVLAERLKEIGSGEEDDLSNY